MKQLRKSELIVNNDGSVYHLGLKPEHLYDTVITVGDPDRVEEVTKYLDTIDYTIQNREFRTVGGTKDGKQLMVMSTGIGTDNIDIVFNELAFLANYDLQTRTPHAQKRKLSIVRLGTSGSMASHLPLGSIVYSKYAISMDDLFFYYKHSFDTVSFADTQFPVIACSEQLATLFSHYVPSLTLTAKGFYGPQFRNAQISPKYELAEVQQMEYKQMHVGNIEMETAGIYGMAALLGFEAISINALLANRLVGHFSENPQAIVERMIKESLEILCK